jgi:PKD repeat protein
MIRDMNLVKILAVVVIAPALAGTAHALVVTFSGTNNPPIPGLGTVCISNLVGASVNTANVDSSQTYTYIANDKSCPGQIFTTGSDPNGYKLLQVSFRAVSYSSTYSLIQGLTYTVRIVKPASAAPNFSTATGLTNIIASEGGGYLSEAAADWRNCDTCNFPTIGDGSGKGTGCGRWITFTFDTPVYLQPNTSYGFDVAAFNLRKSYYEVDGYGASNAYPGGVAYYTGANGAPTSSQNNLSGPRVFVVSMVPGDVGVAPVITSQPQSGVWYGGATAVFRCQVRGDTNLMYRWQKNNANLSQGDTVSGSSTPTLVISNVTAADAASYTVVVTNTSGSVTSDVATLSVTLPPTSGYAYVVYTNHPIAYYRLNETGVNPATQPPTYDNIGGGVGYWGTNSIQTNGPQPPTFLGFESTNAANFSRTNGPSRGVMQSWSTFSSLNTNILNVTIAGWIYPQGTPAQCTGLIFWGGGQAECGMVVSDSGGTVSYDWNDRAVRGDTATGLGLTANQWQFVAMVVNSTSCTLYLGNNAKTLKSYIDSGHAVGTLYPEPLDAHWFAGYDPRWNGEFGDTPQYVLNGVVDEVAVFPRSLSSGEISALYLSAFTNIVGPPVADFAAGPIDGTAPLSVSFTNLSAGATNFAWIFGDGNTSALTDPAYTYTNPGTYSVTLTAVGAGGTNALTRTDYIVVASPPSVTMAIQMVGSNVVVSWPQGTLLEATNLAGPWTTNIATSPYLVAPTAASKFYRVIAQ